MKAHNRQLRQYQRKDSKSISPAEEEEIRQAFDLFDYEHRGRIDYRALKAACRALGFQVKKKDVLEALERFDKTQESNIDFDIFYQVLIGFYLNRTFDDLVERAWDIFDTNKKGYITYSSLRSVVKDLREQLDDDELHDMINTFDSNNDGSVSKDDFRRMLRVYDPAHDPLDDD